MNHITGILSLLLSLSLLTACGGEKQGSPPVAPTDAAGGIEDGLTGTDPAVSAAFRIVDGAEDGNLLLAELEGASGVYRLGTKDLEILAGGEKIDSAALRDGMTVEITWSGDVLETYPAQFSGVLSLAVTDGQTDDRCGLYLQVLEDLWNVDPGLSADVTQLGVDLSGLTDLSDAEKSAVAWRFGELHALTPIQGTYAQLCEQGYIDGEALYWEDGCLFSITTDTDAVWSLPMLGPGMKPPVLTAFDAQKWRSGTGAYFFCDCSARMAEDGTWAYSVGSEAIS